MTVNEEATHYIHAQLLPIVEVLHNSFSASADEVTRFLPGHLSSADHAWLRTHNLRAAVRSHLKDATLDGWKLTGNPRLNGQLGLSNSPGNLSVRVLRDGKPPVSMSPTAGHSRTRRAFWSNPPVEKILQEDLFGQVGHQLLLLWHELGEGEFSLRIVRPTHPGRYGSSLPTDIQIDLPPTRTDFENLKFEVENDEEDLLINIAEEEHEANANGYAG